MKKSFYGVRLRRLREEKGLTQVALAKALALSPSYVNQLEQDQRPLTVPILLKINEVFAVNLQPFSEDEEARLIAEMRDALAETGAEGHVALADLRGLAAGMPTLARTLLNLHKRYRDAMERADLLAARLGEDNTVAVQMPFEEVRDYFYARRNYIDVLDRRAERIFDELGGAWSEMGAALIARFRTKHGIAAAISRGDNGMTAEQRHYDPKSRRLAIGCNLRPGQQVFQLATQLAFIECSDLIDSLVAKATFTHPDTRGLARIGLANYFAGALILPYRLFLSAAESANYDIERLERRFGVGFETVCHRLSTMQRQNARGVPFFFVRVDRAGNMSKRQSATDFHFSRVGGTCPLWNVYEAFSQPGRILVQLAEMPDGRTYLCVARTVRSGEGGFGAPAKTFAIALGCDIRHAQRLVYSKGLDLKNRTARTPIGVGCKICDRAACPQRAFPAMGRALQIDERTRRFAPYSVT